MRGRITFYTNLIKNGSVAGVQDADTTRAAYFAGDAGMIVWSSFLLDELAGLRNDALPTCDECKSDPTVPREEQRHRHRHQRARAAARPSSARRSPFVDRQGRPTRRPAQQFVEYMMSDGYVDWLGLAPEGKFPTRLGTADNPTEYTDAWGKLQAGVDTKKPLGDIYPKDVIEP